MNKPLDLLSGIISPLVFLLLTAGSVAAAGGEPREGAPLPEPLVSAPEVAVRVEDERQVETLQQKGGALGYNFVFGDGYGGRALGYGFLHSSRSGGLFYRNLEKDSNLELEGNFLNEHDYHGDLLLDYRGDYRLHLRTESLFHNLDRELLFSDSGTRPLFVSVQDPASNYGVSVAQDSADFRYRLHNYPLHLNLGYWRLVKEGTIQQRFVDASFEGGANTVYAVARGIDQQTQEGRLGLDAHLGWVDLIYDFRIRVFEDRLPTPTADFLARNDIHGNPDRLGGVQQHNEEPDSRFISHIEQHALNLRKQLVAS